jgi:hypothetical protein
VPDVPKANSQSPEFQGSPGARAFLVLRNVDSVTRGWFRTSFVRVHF